MNPSSSAAVYGRGGERAASSRGGRRGKEVREGRGRGKDRDRDEGKEGER